MMPAPSPILIPNSLLLYGEHSFLNDNGEVLPYFYEKLEQYGFKKNIIETDYKFSDYKEASRIMGAFFGDNMKNSILSNKSNIINEYTGIWNRTIALTGRCFYV